jgi:hypothetical protein
MHLSSGNLEARKLLVDAMTALTPANVALLVWKSSIFSMYIQTKPNTPAVKKLFKNMDIKINK